MTVTPLHPSWPQRPYDGRAARPVRRLPEPPPEERPAWLARLSPREAEVLRCVALGGSNAEIAAQLYISVATVKTHVARLLAKVGARDRVQLVVAAYRSGFVPVDDRRSARCPRSH
jgi:DNA-binding NarL/FixJ family response regulator